MDHDAGEALRQLIREHSDRREREHDKMMALLQILTTKLDLLDAQVKEARRDVDSVREDLTPVHGIPIQRPDDIGKPERRRAPSTDDIKIPRQWVAAALPILKWVLVWLVALAGWIVSFLVQHAKR